MILNSRTSPALSPPPPAQTHDGAKAIVDALRRPVSGASSKPVLGELNLRRASASLHGLVQR